MEKEMDRSPTYIKMLLKVPKIQEALKSEIDYRSQGY